MIGALQNSFLPGPHISILSKLIVLIISHMQFGNATAFFLRAISMELIRNYWRGYRFHVLYIQFDAGGLANDVNAPTQSPLRESCRHMPTHPARDH
jgi:NADH:ubiquinone oxidoreductase subunit D